MRRVNQRLEPESFETLDHLFDREIARIIVEADHRDVNDVCEQASRAARYPEALIDGLDLGVRSIKANKARGSAVFLATHQRSFRTANDTQPAEVFGLPRLRIGRIGA